MPETPLKKRAASISVSPEKSKASSQVTDRDCGRSSAASHYNSKPLVKRPKKKNTYQFAPVNNINGDAGRNRPILKPVSVSQVRNTNKEIKSLKNREGLKKRTAVKEIKNLSIRKKPESEDFKGDGPSEEVIWGYSPLSSPKRDGSEFSDKNISLGTEFEDGTANIEKDSSTPIVHNKFKSVLSFAHINGGEKGDLEPIPINLRKNSLQQGAIGKEITSRPNSKNSLRDIDDIINDIEGGFDLKPQFKPNEMPSSPTNLESSFRRADEDRKKNLPQQSESSSLDSLGEDDSLINILTQKFAQSETKFPKKQERHKSNGGKKLESKDESDNSSNEEVVDDSLIDYLEEYNFTQKKTEQNYNKEETNTDSVEKEINMIENQISQQLVVTEFNSNDKTTEYMKLAKFSVMRKGVSRLVIMSIKEFSVTKSPRQKILTCIDYAGKRSSVIVRAPWVYLDFMEGDVIHIIEGKNFENKRLLSDDKDLKTQKVNDNLLITNPDLLLSATTIGNSIECMRRAVLKSRFTQPGEPGILMTIGSIVHELLQEILKYKILHNTISDKFINEKLHSAVDSYTLDIIMCNETKEEVRKQILEEHVPHIKDFIEKYVKDGIPDAYAHILGTKQKEPISISNVIDIEENIWSPMYGLRGFIDATVEAHVSKDKKLIVPLEIKTGKTKSIAHEAQGSIYTLLLNDRYELPVDFFLLYYTKSNDFTKHPKALESLKHLLILRNQLSSHLKYQLTEQRTFDNFDTKLPPILANSYCDNCYAKTECMVLNKLCEDGTAEDSGLKNGEYEYITSHLVSNNYHYRDFYMKYDTLITKEESSLNGMHREIFLIDSKTRESLSGKCLHGLAISNITEDVERENSFFYTFARKHERDNLPMTNSQLCKNDMVIVSDELGHFSLCTGYVSNISEDSITIVTKRRLINNNVHIPGFHQKNKQVLQSVLTSSVETKQSKESNITYRIDKNEVQQGLALARFNLLNLFLPAVDVNAAVIDEKTGMPVMLKSSQGGDQKTRSLLVDNRSPLFKPGSEPPLVQYELSKDSNFNVDQIAAIDKVMRAEDYALILGMPGTGKTTVIAEIIRILVSQGKTILLTSYTHSAVDNILIKLKKSGIDILRLGNRNRVHPEVIDFLPDYNDLNTYEALVDQFQVPPVVATTCLGINDVLLSLRKQDFDYVILDEASQVSMPVALGPLRFSDKFILVGDHYQLPPLVKNEAARTGGLEVSLFKMLGDSHPESVVELTHQYRMCGDIMALSNNLMYDGKLKCGTTDIQKQKLEVANVEKLEKFKTQDCRKEWLKDIMDSGRRVVFLDYDECETIAEKSDKDNIRNPGEAEIVRQCVEGMIHCGVATRDIGVMTLYRAQLRLLRKIFDAREYRDLEILTADQFQGRDKECVIISMVRCNKQLNGGSLLKELRRVNVAMTRAKSKLIIIGSRSTIGSVDAIKDFIEMINTRRWIYQLPQNCLDCYYFPREPQRKNSRQTSSKSKCGTKNITPKSRLVQDKPLIRDILNGM